MELKNEKSGLGWNGAQAKVKQLNSSSIRPQKVYTSDSNGDMKEKLENEEMKIGKWVINTPTTLKEKIQSSFKKASLISKLDFTAFCLFACGYLVFNYYYWMTHHFM